MEDGEDLRKGSSTLFAVFLFSILSLFLIPYTVYRLCSGGEEASEDVKPWEGVRTCLLGDVTYDFVIVDVFCRVVRNMLFL
jgi:hypothetical protein